MVRITSSLIHVGLRISFMSLGWIMLYLFSDGAIPVPSSSDRAIGSSAVVGL